LKGLFSTWEKALSSVALNKKISGEKVCYFYSLASIGATALGILLFCDCEVIYWWILVGLTLKSHK